MSFVALQMLMGDRAKYLGIIFGVALASLLMIHQSTIFVGILSRTGSIVTDITNVDLLVCDSMTEFLDDVKPMSETAVTRIRGVEGVAWAVRMYKGPIKARMAGGKYRSCIVIGLDDATLIGGPSRMVEGELADLRETDGVIIDRIDAQKLLSQPGARPGDPRVPLRVGDIMELNDRRARVVGICDNTRPFISQPVIYTTHSRALQFAPPERQQTSLVLVKAKPGADLGRVAGDIERVEGLSAYTPRELIWKTVGYYLRNTGIPANFGVTILLAFIVGAAITGQTFYLFTVDNLRFFAALKAMGAGHGKLVWMMALQALVVGFVGYGIGAGLATLFFASFKGTELDFNVHWQLFAFAGAGVAAVIILAGALSIQKVLRLEPAAVFKS
jgi:putative ABC transport system permease protein